MEAACCKAKPFGRMHVCRYAAVDVCACAWPVLDVIAVAKHLGSQAVALKRRLELVALEKLGSRIFAS